MKRVTSAQTAFLCACLLFGLAGCTSEAGGAADIPDAQTVTEDFQKNMHQIDLHSNVPSFVETDAGYYFYFAGLHYVDKADLRATIVCAKPDCDHTNPETCNAKLGASYLLKGGDRIQYITIDFENGKGIKAVQSVKPDGTERRVEQELKFQEVSVDDSSYDYAIYHRGYVYYASDYILYRVAAGGEKDDAEIVWRPEKLPETEMLDGFPIADPNELSYTLWADGDFLYFMVNLPYQDGVYRDTLFQVDLQDLSTKQVWVTPGPEEVGEWETTGVSVSRWYVKDNTIYFYLSGGDFWRGDLSTGRNEKLADTHERTQYASAIFSDDYLCLLNDIPVAFYGDPTVVPGGFLRSYGDTIFVYGLDGQFVREISLKGLYEDPNDTAQMVLVCCSGKDIFFTTTSYTVSENTYGYPGLTGNEGFTNLCHADIDTGEVSVVCRLK